MTEYFLLAVSVSFPLYVYRVRGIWLLLLAGTICVGFACLDEYHQSFVAGRTPSKRDVMIDSIGIAAGVILVQMICFIGRVTVFRAACQEKEESLTAVKDRKEEMTMAGIDEVYEMVVRGKTKAVELAVQDALAADAALDCILNAGMIRAMDKVGAQFKEGVIFVPEMLMSARAMKKGVEVLRPYLVTGAVGTAGKAVIGTVAGDLHDIGKNLVAMMLESAGFEVIDLGVDVSREKFARAIEKNPDISLVCCSALLTTTLQALRDTVAYLNRASFRRNIKIMVGGAPVTQALADEIGADAYTEDAAECARRAVELVKGQGL